MIPSVIVYLLDIIFLNAFYWILAFHSFDSGATHGWFLINVCYIISALVFPPYAQRRLSHIDQVATRCFHTILLMFAVYAMYIAIDNSSRFHPFRFTAIVVAYFFLLFFSRCLSRQVLKYLRKIGRNTKSVLFIGAGHNLSYLHKLMMGDLSTGYRFLGYFEDSESQHLPKTLERLGNVSQALSWLQGHSPDMVFCNLPSSRSSEILAIMNYCESHFIRFCSVPNVRNYVHRAMEVEMIDDMPVLTLRHEPLRNPFNRFLKRSFDLVFSAIFLITCFWWICIIVTIITKITMPGPVFFRQKRNGILGEEFYCWKFRSMKVNADADRLQATKDDPRKTRWGNIMRKTNIDELPQFLNVFLGQMSIVGPRPHMVRHTEEYSSLIDKYMVRHWVKPGVTGWAQVTGARGETEHLWQMEDRITKDIWYIENWSLWLDLRIIFLTIYNILGGEKGNAY